MRCSECEGAAARSLTVRVMKAHSFTIGSWFGCSPSSRAVVIVISKAHHHPDIGTTNTPWDAPWSQAINHYVDRLRAPFSGEDDRVPALTPSTSRRGEKFNAGMGRRCGVADFPEKPSDVYGAVSWYATPPPRAERLCWRLSTHQ